DIACTEDQTYGVYTGYVAYRQSSNTLNLKVTEWDVSGLGVGSTSTLSLSYPSYFHKPRIAAATLYDFTKSTAGTLWNVVDGVERTYTRGGVPGSEYDIVHYRKGRFSSVLTT